METKGTGKNEAEKEGLVGAVRNRMREKGKGDAGREVVQRGTLCLGNGSGGGFIC